MLFCFAFSFVTSFQDSHSTFRKCWLGTYCIPGILVGAGDNEGMKPSPSDWRAQLLVPRYVMKWKAGGTRGVNGEMGTLSSYKSTDIWYLTFCLGKWQVLHQRIQVLSGEDGAVHFLVLMGVFKDERQTFRIILESSLTSGCTGHTSLRLFHLWSKTKKNDLEWI